jgi:hypothetical protein
MTWRFFSTVLIFSQLATNYKEKRGFAGASSHLMTDEQTELLNQMLAELKEIKVAINANTKSTYDAIRYWSH